MSLVFVTRSMHPIPNVVVLSMETRESGEGALINEGEVYGIQIGIVYRFPRSAPHWESRGAGEKSAAYTRTAVKRLYRNFVPSFFLGVLAPSICLFYATPRGGPLLRDEFRCAG